MQPSAAASRPIPLPGGRKLPGSFDRDALRKRVLGGLGFVVPKARPPAGYVVGLSLVAAGLVLMPVAYGALVVFLGWLAVWHAVQAVRTLGSGPYFLFHLPMAAAAAGLVTFLVKPVWFRSKGQSGGVIALTAAEQPLLFEAVGRLCAATGARPPATIEVDCDANAHARFDRLAEVPVRTGFQPDDEWAGAVRSDRPAAPVRPAPGAVRGGAVFRRGTTAVSGR